MSRRCLAIRHVAFEDLGSFAAPIAEAGYQTRYVEAGSELLDDADAAELLVVLGGPIGAYEEARYPWLAAELGVIERRIETRRPVLGVCLGAQLLARAAGARVCPGPVKEIGYAAVRLTEAGRASPLAALADNPTVLHWHGDTFDLSEGARRLAETDAYANQAFSLGPSLGLQFHLEVEPDRLEAWLIGHAAELAGAELDPVDLREQARRHGEATIRTAHAVMRAWLSTID